MGVCDSKKDKNVPVVVDDIDRRTGDKLAEIGECYFRCWRKGENNLLNNLDMG